MNIPSQDRDITASWQPIETAPRDGKEIDAVRLIRGRVVDNKIAYWFEGDLTAGWANVFGKPLGFEPTHWMLRTETPRNEARK